MKSKSKQTFCELFKIGCIGFGGGSALIPLLHRKLVEDNEIITEEEFNKDVLVAMITPGALPVEISVGAGARTAGLFGYCIAPVAISFPGALLSLLLLILLGKVEEGLGRQFSLISMGITAYIIAEVLGYILKTIEEICRGRKTRFKKAEDCQKDTKEKWRLLLKRVGVSALLILAIYIIAGLIISDANSFVWSSCLSSIVSFGGGDAYIAVAEALFVSTGLIGTYEFFSVIVPTVNVTPGSILCKSLACIGYVIGYEASNSIAVALLTAFCGYALSICMSCVTYSVGITFIDTLTSLKFWGIARQLLRIVISVLQLKVIWKLIGSFIGKGGSLMPGTAFWMILLLALAGLNYFAPRIRISKLMGMMISVFVCLCVGNCILLFG